MMRRHGALAAIAAVLLGAQLAHAETLNQLTDAEKSAGWQLLFDGSSKTGWRNYNKPDASDKWVIEDGALKSEKGAGDLITEGQYDYYELSLECISPSGGNAGIIYRCAEPKGPPYVTGPEIQVIGDMNPKSKNSAGSCYDMYAPTKDVLKPNGQWNSVRLVIKPDNQVEHWMNGEKICEYTIGSDDWNQRVASSKWAKTAGYGKTVKGHICLQDHGAVVSFRNIKIRQLKP
ncbi:MAG: DUF1080 domain-containing protein [Planctomycetales bacterium]|nr:DUF1080 domain-containing protein [Planctomycetales bacterium]